MLACSWVGYPAHSFTQNLIMDACHTSRLAGAGAWIEVLDGQGLAPLVPRELLWKAADGSTFEAIPGAGETSQLVLRDDQLGPGVIQVRALGHVALTGRLDLTPGANRLLLEPAGSLRVQLLDREGEGVQGVRLGSLFE